MVRNRNNRAAFPKTLRQKKCRKLILNKNSDVANTFFRHLNRVQKFIGSAALKLLYSLRGIKVCDLYFEKLVASFDTSFDNENLSLKVKQATKTTRNFSFFIRNKNNFICGANLYATFVRKMAKDNLP